MTVEVQAGVRRLFDRHGSQLWGVLDWVPGGWAGQLVTLLVIAVIAGLVAWLVGRAARSGRVRLNSDESG
ncbi:hypothetical protein [Nocardia pseudobrasiliensis]|uniref:Uncharacterized protein n=1 Tax=Nocardia pseudobrasiliensis TaxID=45979 RepID=A0A370HWP3_9NOCA|nr:hypothetical protein [Nocardia pseudobrasiliensis]RDI62875.1 hypothetical protein DFR76_112193 [Nocardia pseudobrasiliensis]